MTSRADEAPMVLTLEQAARALQVSRTVIYELARAGRLPTVRVGRRRRVPLAALEQLLAEGGEALAR